MDDHTTDFDAVVVGAGFAGIYALHRLRSLGFTVRALEAGDGIGGTWYWNRYPGARVDVESLFCSYSFDPELQQEYEWTERYPARDPALPRARRRPRQRDARGPARGADPDGHPRRAAHRRRGPFSGCSRRASPTCS